MDLIGRHKQLSRGKNQGHQTKARTCTYICLCVNECAYARLVHAMHGGVAQNIIIEKFFKLQSGDTEMVSKGRQDLYTWCTRMCDRITSQQA